MLFAQNAGQREWSTDFDALADWKYMKMFIAPKPKFIAYCCAPSLPHSFRDLPPPFESVSGPFLWLFENSAHRTPIGAWLLSVA
jgi:hypothetical protein